MKVDVEIAADDYMSRIPQCSRRVAIISPNYGDRNFRCKVIAYPEKLFSWAEHHSKSVWSNNEQEQIARICLPRWLLKANLNDQNISLLTPEFYKVLRPYVQDFVVKGIAQIYCDLCQSFIDNPMFGRAGERRPSPYNASWTSIWKCQKGHLLYYEDQEVRFTPVKR